MKNAAALFMILVVTTAMIPQHTSAQQTTVSFQLFYDELSPYGMWVEYPDYGYVWIPNSDPGFSPYGTDGHWVYTVDGWMWVSDYPWGWAAFHYGRWDYDNEVGWFWVPDNVWGPAWVSWRRSPGYYGWAPLRPGISISIAFGSNYYEQNDRWIFVRESDIVRNDVSRHYISRSRNRAIIRTSSVISNSRNDEMHNAVYIAGPDREEVQRTTRVRVDPVTVREHDRPGQRLQKNEIQLYKPQMERRTGSGQNPAPAKVIRKSEVRPIREHNAPNQPQNVVPSKGKRTPPPQQQPKITPQTRKRTTEPPANESPREKKQPKKRQQ